MQSYGTERDRSYLLDIERRELNVNAVFLRATQLSQPIYIEPPVPSSMSMYLRQPWETPTDDTYIPLDSTDMKLLKLGNRREQSGVSHSSDVLIRMETAHALAAITEGIAAVEVEVEVETEEGDERAYSAGRNVVKRDNSAHVSSTASAAHPTANHSETSLSLKPDTAHTLEVAAAAADAAMSDLNYLLRDSEEDGGDHGVDDDDDDDQYLQQHTPLDSTGCASLTVIFDGSSRALCDFKVKVVSRNGADSQQALKGFEKSDVAVGGAVGAPRATGVHDDVIESWIDDYLISSVSDSDSGSILTNGIIPKSENNSDGDAINTADHCQPLPLPLPLVLDSVELASVVDMDEEYSAYLGKKTVCPKVEDDVISRMIYIDRLSYSGAVRHRMLDISECSLHMRQSYRTAPHHITSHHITSHHTTSHHITTTTSHAILIVL